MKRATIVAMLALACSTPAAARTGDEVRLHIEAVGEVPPDRATVTLSQQQQGSSQAAANTALDRQHTELVRQLGQLGIAPGDIDWTREAAVTGASTDMMVDDAGSASEPTFYANATVTITLRDTSRLATLTAGLSAMPDAPTVSSRSIRFSFSDERAARTQAIQRGFVTARQDAEVYAAAAQMRIARVESVSNANSPVSALDMQQFIAKFIGMIDNKSFNQDSFNSIAARVVVDYVLAPL